MIPVGQALDRLFALAPRMGSEDVPLLQAATRVLAADVVAARDQPPFDASAMDGWAVRTSDALPGARLAIVGEAPAGRAWGGTLGPGQAVRIFTGGPVPAGADRVVIQEDAQRDGDTVILGDRLEAGSNIRPRGADFASGSVVPAPRRLRPADIALIAAMNVLAVTVARRPEVAILMTGDELVPPGGTPGPAQIVASNGYGLAAMVRAEGGVPRLLPVVPDDPALLAAGLALARGADVIVTVGGASVGDHDLVAGALRTAGADMAFHKVAIRPGKPLMAGRLGDALVIGLPGNPVSALVCGMVFLVPVLRAMQGLPGRPLPRARAALADALPPNGPREHYMRATWDGDRLSVEGRQDSSLLSVLSTADVLVVRPPGDPARQAGEMVDYLAL
ncbi:MAG: molybdopterin molybdotransferase MoeA [Rhodobacteraceae bacterium]|jgi:molybdopterin molybdotransferase|nr:molybdopterin molybdotransferase MoeA [Paracoccaceae bacterium]